MMNNTIATAPVNTAIASAKPCKRTNYATRDAQPFRELVEDYMFRMFWYDEVKSEREEELKSVNNLIDGLENMKGSALWNPQQMLDALELRDKQTAQLNDWMNKGVRWSVEKDSALDHTYKTYRKFMRNGDTPAYAVRMAVNYLYEQYGLVCGTEDMLYILENCTGRTAQSNAKRVWKSGQTVWTKERTKNDFCKTLISTIAEMLIARNAVRPARIAPELVKKYETVKNNSKKN